ncbi:hypothetical protein SAMN02745126_02687 [Enhydrobacter aerosaccus]|uniref:MAPEG family protein n=1 Tax=Enhydrobacter aerosaccus TaxID=225324 RepID=A0A1T4P9R3_9HYPH|nr:MAPEG family protein [Enhydrobacter aerosaccus]SJZ88232.1 hypothetical protein SAMN02745126_02687 [Enhydrobacter aerosaccus]
MNPPNFPIVTATTAVILAFLQVALMLWTSVGRAQLSTGLGDGGDNGLLRRIRMHGNLAENLPIFLILLVLVEVAGEWRRVVPAIATIFVLARIAHVIGLARTDGPSVPRVVGALGTAISTAALVVMLAVTVVADVTMRS